MKLTWESLLAGARYATPETAAENLRLSREVSPEETTERVFDERRRSVRRPIGAVVAFCIGNDARWHPARVRDCSPLGLKLAVEHPVENGREIIISPTNLAATAMRGTVRWTTGTCEAGVEFLEPIGDIVRRLSI